MLKQTSASQVILLSLLGLALALAYAPKSEGQTALAAAKGKVASTDQIRLENVVVKERHYFIGPPDDRSLTELLPNLPASPLASAYQGSTIRIDDKVEGELGDFHKKFAAIFKANDPQPQSRSEHFGWIPFSKSLVKIGWIGIIEEVESRPDGSTIVLISIQPQIWGNTKNSILLDFVHEKYLVYQGKIRLIETDALNVVGHYHVWHGEKSAR